MKMKICQTFPVEESLKFFSDQVSLKIFCTEQKSKQSPVISKKKTGKRGQIQDRAIRLISIERMEHLMSFQILPKIGYVQVSFNVFCKNSVTKGSTMTTENFT